MNLVRPRQSLKAEAEYLAQKFGLVVGRLPVLVVGKVTFAVDTTWWVVGKARMAAESRLAVEDKTLAEGSYWLDIHAMEFEDQHRAF